MSHPQRMTRLRAIGKRRLEILEELVALEIEEARLYGQLEGALWNEEARPQESEDLPGEMRRRGRRGDVPLPLGEAVDAKTIADCIAEITKMEDFDRDARPFIEEWYPKLATTACWHEVSRALQNHFGRSRQQIAGIAAHVSRQYGEQRANA